MRNPDVEFCGYSIPHPSEAKLHIRIQTRSNFILLGTSALSILERALNEVKEMADHTLILFSEACTNKMEL